MDPELYKASQSGDVDYLQGRVNEAAADLLSQRTPNKSSILHIAAQFNRLEFFKQAESPVLLHHANTRGDTALHVAAREGSTEVVDFIINHAGKGKQGIYSVDIEKGQAVVDEGNNKELLRMVNRDGDNALHLAAQYGHYQVAKLLLEADKELSRYENKAGQSACFMATVRNEITMVELLLGLSPPCSLQGGANGMTALHAAVFTSRDIVVKIVNARPELVGESDDMGWTPLHYASACDERVAAVNFFLERDRLAAYSVGKEGESALHIAAFNGCLDVMKVLVDTHPDCWHLLNKKGQTALHAAVLGEQPDIVKYIVGFPGIAKSVDCTADNDGNTPLHLAALCKSKAMIKLLCEGKGRDEILLLLRATNEKNLTALDIWGNEAEGFQDGLRPELKEIIIGLRKRHKRPIIYQENNLLLKDSTGKLDDGNKQDLLQVTATLIATVTFSAGFTMPGGYNQSGGQDEGMSVLASKAAFQAFLVFDIIAFFTAIIVVLLQFTRCTKDEVRKKIPRWILLLEEYSEILITFAFLAMGLAFACALYVALVKSAYNLALAAIIISVWLSCLIFFLGLGSRLGGSPLFLLRPR